ncbi:unnamed protein product [Fusarium langsethiae]|nr:unnamed protein product [Fusarium langsethiae]
MLPDRPLEEEDIDILGRRRDIDINYDWTPRVGRYADDGILNSDYWKQRKAENTLDLDVDDQPLEARDSLNPEQRIVPIRYGDGPLPDPGSLSVATPCGWRRRHWKLDIGHYLVLPVTPPNQ